MLVYLSLGSNIGNRLKNIQTAIKLLKEIGFDIIKASSLYETSPWPVRRDKPARQMGSLTGGSLNGLKIKTEQPDFLNLVLKGKTKFSPEELLQEIKQIEKTMGREKTEKWGPRIIDIDILFYEKKFVNTRLLQPSRSPHQRRRRLTSNGLQIPHPQLHKRAFVLIPLKEIAPNLVHPVLKKTVSQMLNDLPARQAGGDDKGSVVLYNKLKEIC
ncbi:MAG: 2-amino-4-hydroxy-6-hydroxymethyldihydropteridine diphosphokinase [Candidatus Omnitrophica bacterium]|nr:2-amino-4-hydroxy-6-hydroxymethyldihydropteridine diphosphokinase [Candidatus Omnitrophota bacterium]MBU1047509.1 2-amino-4-hydroxy-6-hydroxymethyldihydropteridine diphosphokinase [Candidatus Omnitrophota bacterium]MBU1631242.1 2-amino-4-hydroxy-6-hydroxymethyldihydropteridine diphosphokinase [Candidatus Omnitrophota bacterium]MBU1766774.1 2-amino-4-hydroxy-6-hydroxymethyldihydropteridine diphosphokinase [Candidatus Omnitrophota bacterium]MBU1888872.1 2-amino-4-hydroxy-6-hydroxymethyldihydro